MENVGNVLLNKALEYLQSAEAFAKSEVPLYLQELLQFKIVEHLICYFDDILILGVIFSIFTTIYFKFVAKLPSGTYDEKDYKNFFSVITIAGSVVCFCGMGIGICHTEHLISAYKAYASPRVYLVDYVKSSVSSKECSK